MSAIIIIFHPRNFISDLKTTFGVLNFKCTKKTFGGLILRVSYQKWLLVYWLLAYHLQTDFKSTKNRVYFLTMILTVLNPWCTNLIGLKLY